MNLNHPKHPWTRLVAAAGTVKDDRDTTAPYGFATRVVAIAFAQERKLSSLFERFSLRALGIACVLTVVTVATNYSVAANFFAAREETPLMTNDDPVAELVAVASS
jgi:hypothetical protein